jgi:1-aminocyclopropane-1-carboxylate deaminase/D-cysteine desulfhydrase-like pyridoxal-dependent ACC family enzyme
MQPDKIYPACPLFLNARKIKGIHRVSIFKFMFFMDPLSLDSVTIHRLPSDGKVEISVLRLDKIHPDISGNKWFKLKFYLDDAISKNTQTIATFGGAWSNHILATAAACRLKNLRSIGIIRGEEPKEYSYTLHKSAEYGMKLIFISRIEYSEKIVPPELLTHAYIIDEGGYGEKGVAGAATIADFYRHQNFTHICCAAGTGTMMAGLIRAASASQAVVGISVLKNNTSLVTQIKSLLTNEEKKKKYTFVEDYHFGGYAKYTPALIDFMNKFYRDTSIPTDFVYTGKLIYGVFDLAAKGYFPANSRLLVIHSGGLQGNQSLRNGKLIF